MAISRSSSSARGGIGFRRRSQPIVFWRPERRSVSRRRPTPATGRRAGEWLATVNDDVELDEHWLAQLLAAAEGRTEVAALQGVNLRLGDERLADGCGLAWNRWLQAVQIGHGDTAPPADVPAREIFGVSATAALYRRASLAGVELEKGAPFAARFESYYEDVDLAARLRSAGRRALLVPAARARHAGSATGGRYPGRRARLTYGNRLLTLRRALGRALWRELPLIAARDGIDSLRALGRGDFAASLGILAGWARALWRAGGLEAPPSRFNAAELRQWSP